MKRNRIGLWSILCILFMTPITLFAASEGSMTKEIIRAEEEQTFYDAYEAGGLKIVFKDAALIAGKQEEFYLDLENAVWEGREYWSAQPLDLKGLSMTDIVIMPITEERVKVQVTLPDSISEESEIAFTIPLLVKVTKGEAKIAINKSDETLVIEEGEWVFATTENKKANWEIGPIPTFNTIGAIAPITFTEIYKGSIGTRELNVTLELTDPNYAFSITDYISKQDNQDDTDYTLDASKYIAYEGGFTGTPLPIEAKISHRNGQSISFVLKGTVPDEVGKIILKNLIVKSLDASRSAQDVTINIKGEELILPKDNNLVAKVSKESTYLELKEGKQVTIRAGQIGDVSFTLGEFINSGIPSNGTLEISLDKGYFVKDSIAVSAQQGNTSSGKPLSERITYEYLDKNNPSKGIAKIKISLDNNVANVYALDSYTFKAKVYVPINDKNKGSIYLNAISKQWDKPLALEAIEVKNPFNILIQPMMVEKGGIDQKGGQIILKETEKGMLSTGDFKFFLQGSLKGAMKFTGIPDIDVKTKMRKEDVVALSKLEDTLNLQIKRKLDEPLEITLKDLLITADRTLATGNYDLYLTGPDIDVYNNPLIIKDFFKIQQTGVANSNQEIGKKQTVVFTINSKTYTVNGQQYEMTAAPYMQKPGYTMIPLRYVVEAFGLSKEQFTYSGGVVTLVTNGRMIQLIEGSNIALVGNAKIKMQAPIVVKNGRTYAPIGEIARLLGLSKIWDAGAQKASFTY